MWENIKIVFLAIIYIPFMIFEWIWDKLGWVIQTILSFVFIIGVFIGFLFLLPKAPSPKMMEEHPKPGVTCYWIEDQPRSMSCVKEQANETN